MIYCNCPTRKMGKSHNVICKHCCFVLFKVLKLHVENYEPIFLNILIFTSNEIQNIKEAFQK